MSKNFLAIPYSVLHNKKLTLCEKITLSIIISYNKSGQDFYISSSKLGDYIGVNNSSTKRSIKHLEELKYIYEDKTKHYKSKCYVANLDIINVGQNDTAIVQNELGQNAPSTCIKMHQAPRSKCTKHLGQNELDTCIKMNHNNNIDKINDNNNYNNIDKINNDKSFPDRKDERDNKSKTEKKKEPKHKFGEFEHVLLNDSEMNSLLNDFGNEIFTEYVKRLDEYIEMKGAKYKNHNLVIRNWIRRGNENSKGNNKTPTQKSNDYNSTVNELLEKERAKNGQYGNFEFEQYIE
ncbi:hypothetical protein [Candidatus Galacturonibacter soehngenii]|uniref:Helix-turn-helix domain-containing protein n=1 Tax=Candidatus Galacturonatibacter soehngenii TaxID=2307010 RepID=A0A7V7QJ22_9FIRM|nr:hypothetical protein [Candidatus Galacturonibacter soehngenii]KAB1437577.1 hypothetical protein F7O84_08195 [Candidatus Galacturonibacter soehngenii]